VCCISLAGVLVRVVMLALHSQVQSIYTLGMELSSDCFPILLLDLKNHLVHTAIAESPNHRSNRISNQLIALRKNLIQARHFAMMDHTNMSHHMPKTMAEMPMTFFTSTTTPLYSNAWTPKTAAQYAMTCLFLVFLCIIFRGLLAARCNMLWLLAYGSSKNATPEEVSCCAEEVASQKPLHGELMSGSPSRHQDGPTRVREILLRAVLDTALAIVSYLLWVSDRNYIL
jgi:copper transporter 1